MISKYDRIRNELFGNRCYATYYSYCCCTGILGYFLIVFDRLRDEDVLKLLYYEGDSEFRTSLLVASFPRIFYLNSSTPYFVERRPRLCFLDIVPVAAVCFTWSLRSISVATLNGDTEVRANDAT